MASWKKTIISPFRKACTIFNQNPRDHKKSHSDSGENLSSFVFNFQQGYVWKWFWNIGSKLITLFVFKIILKHVFHHYKERWLCFFRKISFVNKVNLNITWKSISCFNWDIFHRAREASGRERSARRGDGVWVRRRARDVVHFRQGQLNCRHHCHRL